MALSVSGFAQDKKIAKEGTEKEKMERFTPEQQNELMLKKMTLELDLSSKQQSEMKSMIAERTAKRQAMMKSHKENMTKPTKEERFAMKSKMLDEQIATKAKMKSMLSPEQFVKWEKMKDNQDRKRSLATQHKRGAKMNDQKGLQK